MGRRISIDEILDRLNKLKDFAEYTIDVETVNGSSKKAKFTHTSCPNNNSSNFAFEMIVKDFLGGQRCPKCAAVKRVISNTKNNVEKKEYVNKINNIDKYITRINSVKGYEYVGVHDDNYHGVHTKMDIKHLDCNTIFSKRISDFIYNEQLCPNCTGKGGRKKDINETLKRIDDAGFELDETLPEHLYSSKSYRMKCKACGEVQQRSLNTIINLNGKCKCASRRVSNGENIVMDVLNDLNIKYVTNKTFDNLVYDSNLRCDFYLDDYNSVIEYDGIQHFIERDNIYYHDDLSTIQSRDRSKNKFCADNGITIIRISYKERTKSSIKRIISEFLNIERDKNTKIDGKPYDGKLSRTVWIGGKSNYEEYVKYNSKWLPIDITNIK